MSGEDDFRIRPGRIRSTRAQQARPFIAQALAAAQRAGGRVSRSGQITKSNRSRFGRGQRATVQANRLLTSRSRNVVIKTRVVRHTAKAAPLSAHLNYLRREGVTRDGEKARLFGPETGDADPKAFAERTQDDRHHFRFIVSPEDATEMSDLRTYARDLMGQMEKDLGTKLDWVGVDHWNTDNPHVHIILRGRTDDSQDLVISRDYIKEGMRARAQDLVTQELGPRTEQEIRRNLGRQVEAERWTDLDRQISRDSYRSGIVDLAPRPDQKPDEFHALKVGRLRKLETLGLADQVGPGQWVVSETAEKTLRALGERGDIIKRIHRGLTERGIERGAASYVLAGESIDDPVIGRLVDRGLDDELKGTAYAVVDGTDGRTHHIKLPDLDAAADSAPGSIVELRKFDDVQGRRRVALAVRSDLDIEQQVHATGATWLDRQEIETARTSRLFSGSDSRGAPAAAGAAPALPHAPDLASLGLAPPPATPSAQERQNAFLNAATDRRTVSPDRVVAPASPNVLQAGAVIAAALITGIRSDLPGQITAQVTENIYDSPTGRILLVPQGTRIIGQYDNNVQFGQSRVLLVWNRLIFPNGRSIVLERQPGADVGGYAGLQDGVDYHWWDLAKAAGLSTLLGVGAELAADNDDRLIQAIRNGGQDTINDAGQQIVRRQLNVAPTLTIRPGFPVRVVVTRDLVLESYGG